MSNHVYIAEVASIFPKRHDAEFIADRMFPCGMYGAAANLMARRFATRIGVKARPSVVDFELYPEIQLADEADHPLVWGAAIVDKLTTRVPKEDVGCFCVAYNISRHDDTLPNLASQIVMRSGLDKIEKAEELANYGCAAGIFALSQAVDYCREHNRPAIVFTFDQCTTHAKQVGLEDPDFRRMLTTNLLFNDGGVGLLLIPQSMRSAYERPLPQIKATETMYRAGNLIGMRNGRFLMNDGVKDTMPKLVSSSLVKPFLSKQGLNSDDIDEWSIHQGGSEVLKQFQGDSTLGLTTAQIARSLYLFHLHGNVSAPSCLLVLESFFEESASAARHLGRGLVVGFGAGYYLGVLLYEWDSGAVAHPRATQQAAIITPTPDSPEPPKASAYSALPA